ncbi:MAG: hypothetical protein QM676_11735 [Novosphingobium sp.]
MRDKTVPRLQFILVDKNPARAAAIFAALLSHGRGITVSEGLGELTSGSPAGRYVVLAADEAGTIAEVVEKLSQARSGAKIIAYGENPSPHRIVQVMAAGAADYLPWPLDPATIVAAAHAAIAAGRAA